MRGAAERSAIITAFGTGMNADGFIFVAFTTEVGPFGQLIAGYKETWMIANHAGSIGTLLMRTECPGGGSQ